MTIENNISVLKSYDWQEAFKTGSLRPIPGDKTPQNTFSVEDVIEIYKIHEGYRDEDSWQIYGHLKDGRYFYLEAWCDYSGWD